MNIAVDAAVRDEPRFAFGENWQAFVSNLTEAQIRESERALRESLGVVSLKGKSFLDIGCGSGLSSLAARRLGASVHAFDYDPNSVACSKELKARYAPHDLEWRIEQGSVLDETYLKRLGQFDVVYSWGVLHHTGEMWKALTNVDSLVSPRGILLVALYNEVGYRTEIWKLIKRLYNVTPSSLRFLILGPALLRIWGPTVLRDMLRGNPLKTWKNHKSRRGMNAWRDLVDWVGGYPYEAAKPEEVIWLYKQRGYQLSHGTLDPGLGCNEFVFKKRAASNLAAA